MFAMNLVDITDKNTFYGILTCENDDITEEKIQKRIFEIKEMLPFDLDWTIDEVIANLPKDWGIHLQKGHHNQIAI